ncbi:MAG: CopG family antitoxin [Patescibacteria group bacterium]
MKKINTQLSPEEKEIITAFAAGELVPVRNAVLEKFRLKAAAKHTQPRLKNKNINLRINEDDLQRLKARAAKEGMPYQTLLTSLIHKFVTNQL